MQSSPQATFSTPLTVCSREVLDAVPPAVWFIRKEMRQHRKGMSMAQLRTLVRVATEPKTSLSAVAEHLGASLSTTSRTVAGLVAKGFLTRHDCTNDRRQLVLTLTCKGRNVMEAVWPATQKRMDDKLRSLTPAQLKTLTDAMQILKTNFGSVGHSNGKPDCPPQEKSTLPLPANSKTSPFIPPSAKKSPTPKRRLTPNR